MFFSGLSDFTRNREWLIGSLESLDMVSDSLDLCSHAIVQIQVVEYLD